MPSRVPWWGLRRSPLRRRSDVIEAWAVLVVGVMLFLGAPAAGVVAGALAHRGGVAAARAERTDRHRVPAVLTENAPPVVPAADGTVLAEAIIGNTKAAVASVFGPPRSAALRGVVKANAGTGSGYWNATTWYYPLPRNESLAMAIEFEEESARRVEFIRAPGV